MQGAGQRTSVLRGDRQTVCLASLQAARSLEHACLLQWSGGQARLQKTHTCAHTSHSGQILGRDTKQG